MILLADICVNCSKTVKIIQYYDDNNTALQKKSSTELAALEVIDRLLNQLNKHKIPTNLYLDLAKAFDSLSHDILLYKLVYHGVQNKAKDLYLKVI